jgi:predicted MPP superfamily phosphohydrolase
LNTELVTIKKATREIGNIISAVIHSPDKSISAIQKQNVSKLCNDFADACSRIDEREKKIFDKIKEISKQKGLDADVVVKVLKEFDYLEQEKRKIIKQYRLTEPFNIEYFLTNREWDEHISAQIDEEVCGLESKFLNQKSKLNISETIHFANLKVTSFSVGKSDFYVSLINDYLSFCDTEETQTNIALKAGKILSQMYNEKNEKWDDSKTRKYINSLLANLQGRGDFSVLDHDDIFLRSLSIFVQSKNEIDRIEKALIDNLIPDFHFAFGLWGAFWGFANMPKTLTNELFLSEGLEYVSEVYKYIFKQIHGIELEGKIERKQVEKPQPTTVTISSKINEPADNTAKTATSNQSQLEQEPSDSEEHKSRDKTTKQEFIEKSSDAEINSLAERDREKTVSIESKNQKGQKGKSKQTGNKKTKKQQDQCDAPTLFEADAGFKPAKDFYKDSNAYSYVEYILPTAGKTREQFKVDLDWFQGNHNEWYNDTKKGNQKGWYYKNPKDNQSVLETFKKYLENKKTQKDTEKDGTKKSMQWLRDIYTSIDVDKIIGKLKSVYK